MEDPLILLRLKIIKIVAQFFETFSFIFSAKYLLAKFPMILCYFSIQNIFICHLNKNSLAPDILTMIFVGCLPFSNWKFIHFNAVIKWNLLSSLSIVKILTLLHLKALKKMKIINNKCRSLFELLLWIVISYREFSFI